MNQIVIGIPTYKRTALLEKLIKSIFSLYLDEAYVKHVEVVIVDNDKNRSAKEIILNLEKEAPNQFGLHYFHNPNKGLSHVRNEILFQSNNFNPDFLACVDDDEYVSVNWLNELLKTIINNNADIVTGPVLPEFEDEFPIFITKWFERKIYPNNTLLNTPIGAGNLILRATFINNQNIVFDARFNSTGAEDTYFSLQALKRNAKIFFSEYAIAHENIPKSRANINWLFKRSFRGGNTYTYIQLIEKNYISILKKILVNICSVFVGIPLLLILLFPIKNRYYPLLKFIAPSLGSFAAIFNFKYHEYDQNN